jgi:hypothetical protein
MKSRFSALPLGACVLAAAMGEGVRAIPVQVRSSPPLEVIVHDETPDAEPADDDAWPAAMDLEAIEPDRSLVQSIESREDLGGAASCEDRPRQPTGNTSRSHQEHQ